MTTRPYELLVRFGINGAIAGASVRSITTVNGRDYEGDPEPLSGASDPAFTEFAKQFSAAAIVERDTAKSELAAEKTEHDATKASLATITAERDSLQSQVDELKPQVDTLPGLNGQITSLTAERDSLQSLSETLQQQVDTIPGMQEQITTLTAEVERLTALVPPPVPDVFANADWVQFRARILSDAAVQRVAIGNPTAWPLMVLYLSQLATTPSRGVDIAQLWSFLIVSTPITADEVAGINTIANECGVPLAMNPDGSIG